jgi:hypothetical protein
MTSLPYACTRQRQGRQASRSLLGARGRSGSARASSSLGAVGGSHRQSHHRGGGGGGGTAELLSSYVGLVVHCVADGIALGTSSLSTDNALRYACPHACVVLLSCWWCGCCSVASC